MDQEPGVKMLRQILDCKRLFSVAPICDKTSNFDTITSISFTHETDRNTLD